MVIREKIDKSIYSVELEMALIGCLVLDHSLISRIENFNPDDFFQKINTYIYNIIVSLHQNEESVTRQCLVEKVADGLKIKYPDITSYLLNCVHSSATATNPAGLVKHITELAQKRKIVTCCKKYIEQADHPKTRSSTLIEDLQEEIFNIALYGNSEKNITEHQDALAATLKTIENSYQKKGVLLGVTTGFKDLDKKLHGFQKSDLIIIAGRPSMGKTALAVNMAVNAACDKKTALFFSLEMSTDQLSLRMISSGVGIPCHKLRSGLITQSDYDAMVEWKENKMKPLQFFIDDSSNLNISKIRHTSRKILRKYNLDIIFIDYLQLINSNKDKKNYTRVDEISKITRELKQLAKELDVPIVALSQLSRAVEQREDKRPLLSDLRESGSIEQDADVVMFIYREEYYIRRMQPRQGTPEHEKWQQAMANTMNQAEIIIAKHRNGPTANIPVHFEHSTTTFGDWSESNE